MCEFTASKNQKKAIQYFHNTKATLNLSDFMSIYPYAFQYQTCPVCGEHLTERQMRPSGRATRCMCVRCYDELVARRYNANCIVCAEPLPADKIREQLQNRREITRHMHEGECWSIWVMLHNTVLGEIDAPASLGTQISDSVLLPRPEPQSVLVTNRYKNKPIRVIT
jgi:hypothetical protein